MTKLRFIVMTRNQADALRGDVSPGVAIDPVEVHAGEFGGSYVVPERLLRDSSFSPILAQLSALSVVEIDPADGWPPVG